jgi:type VI secretion system protein ImpC
MTEEFSLSKVEFQLSAGTAARSAHLADDETPFRLLLIGDWSGRMNRRLVASSEELKTARPLLIDRDNVDQLMARLGVRLQIPFTGDGSQALTIRFNQIDDFHPDRLFNRLEIFDELRELRQKLKNPKTFAEASDELRKRSASAETPEEQSTEVAKSDPALAGNLLDQILSGESTALPDELISSNPDAVRDISELARAVVKPYLSPDIEDDQRHVMAAVDAQISNIMNLILHHPEFQSIEAAWRAVRFLVDRIETGPHLKLYLLDISFAELTADVEENENVESSALYKILVEQTVRTSGGLPWALVAANYTFDFAGDDRKYVEAIARISAEAGAPFVSGVTSYLLGCESLATTPDPDDWTGAITDEAEEWWNTIRQSSSSDYIGFGLPRFLLRLPYGSDTDATEEFDFEESDQGKSPPLAHEVYLWANSAFAVACLLAEGFSKNGWQFRPTDVLEIENLPLHVYEHDGESRIKPCAETLLTVRGAEEIIDRGLMPLLSIKDSDTIRLGMFQSVAGSSLRGRWYARERSG